jgi:hypothetical protein
LDYWADLSAWKEHRRELLREAQERQLELEARKARETFAPAMKRPETTEVRWGLLEDEAKVAELLELNGMPRWVAFEERFAVAERDGEVLAAVSYRTEPKRLLFDLLVADPWVGERRLAVDLYAGVRRLALELGASSVVARIDRRRAELPAGGWRRRIALLSASVAPLLLPKKE